MRSYDGSMERYNPGEHRVMILKLLGLPKDAMRTL